ncbi:MAG: hemerythrin domain-containing protein [Sporichthyaceae bacterium]
MADDAPDIGTADITALILDDHEWFRRQFAALDDARTPEELSAVWEPLATRLDTHADAEEQIFYPRLLLQGEDDPKDETEDAVHDHNEIREAVEKARAAKVGSDDWYAAVDKAREENSEHLAEEEDGPLRDFRKNATREQRAELAQQWIAFYAAHPAGRGVDTTPKDPAQYIEDNS